MERNGICRHDFDQTGILNALDRRPGEHRMRATCINLCRTVFDKRFDSLHQRTGRIDDVVDDETGAAPHITDHVHHLGHIRLDTPLVHDSQLRTQPFGKRPGAFDAPGIWRHDGEVGQIQFLKMLDQNGCSEQVIHRYAEEPLNLGRMQIHRQQTIGPGCHKQVRNHLR